MMVVILALLTFLAHAAGLMLCLSVAEAAFTGPILLIAANVGAIRDHRQYDRIEQMEQRVLAALEQREQRRKDEEGGAA